MNRGRRRLVESFQLVASTAESRTRRWRSRVGTALAPASLTAASRHFVRSRAPVPRLAMTDAPRPRQRCRGCEQSSAVGPCHGGLGQSTTAELSQHERGEFAGSVGPGRTWFGKARPLCPRARSLAPARETPAGALPRGRLQPRGAAGCIPAVARATARGLREQPTAKPIAWPGCARDCRGAALGRCWAPQAVRTRVTWCLAQLFPERVEVASGHRLSPRDTGRSRAPTGLTPVARNRMPCCGLRA